ncbi:MAG: S-layer homology domain-containing protein [Bacillota bacterium]|nr:S-layer homology domain-containing protein [Bacillota bacterium]
MKKNVIGLIALILVLVISSIPTYAAWYDTYINTCKELGALNNDPHSPNDNINRLETACLIDSVAKGYNIEFPKLTTKQFWDINLCDANSQASILKLADANIINGYADGSFMPGNYVTRAEFASIIYKSFFKPSSKTVINRFRDFNKDQWYYECVTYLDDKCIISGYQDDKGLIFKPDNFVTHAEACKILVIAAQKADIISAQDPNITESSKKPTYLPVDTDNYSIDQAEDSNMNVKMDKDLEKAIKTYLLMSKNVPITDEELKKPISDKEILETKILVLNNCGISCLQGLRRFKNLESLEITNNNISDISELSYLKKLDSLRLDFNSISNISPLKFSTKITSFSADVNKITDFTPLAGNKRLNSLYIRNNNCQDISFLSGFPLLDSIDISGNKIKNINVLGSLKNLTALRMIDNNVSDISALKDLPLIMLFIEGNPIKDFSPIENKEFKSTDYKPKFR